jgi:hypothetical protein
MRGRGTRLRSEKQTRTNPEPSSGKKPGRIPDHVRDHAQPSSGTGRGQESTRAGIVSSSLSGSIGETVTRIWNSTDNPMSEEESEGSGRVELAAGPERAAL